MNTSETPFYEASAPGRLDVMGGVADYSGSLLLQMPIAERTTVRFSYSKSGFYELTSALPNGETLSARYNLEQVRALPESDDIAPWARYILGACALLEREGLITLSGGSLNVSSEVPLGKGLSSSAALEVAVLRVLAKAYNLVIEPTKLAQLAQRVEHEYVGAPCGLMDQLAVHCGVSGMLLPIRCQPAEVEAPILIPRNLRFEHFDSGVRHHVTGDPYAEARAAAFMGLKILEDRHRVRCDGYLANVSVSLFERYRDSLPVALLGRDFQRVFGDTDDALTTVHPDVSYRVQACASHPVYEQERIAAFAKTLRDAEAESRPLTEAELSRIGQAMLASHASYTAIGLGHPATDRLVQQLMQRPEVVGARVTGAGCGGTVVAAVRDANSHY